MPSMLLTRVEENTSGGTRRSYKMTADEGYINALGSIDYDNGVVALHVLPEISENTYNPRGNWSSTVSEATLFETGVVTLRYSSTGAASTPVSTSIPMPGIQIRLLPAMYDETIVPESVQFTWNGVTFLDRAGVIYRDVDPVTGSGTPAGTINYLDGICNLTNYNSGAGAVNVTSLLTTMGQFVTDEAYFRTSYSPLAPESLSVTATAEDGTLIIGQSQPDGSITGAGISEGQVNFQFGTASVKFSGRVIPSSIRYSAVAWKFLPLAAEIIGMDAVRLPPDGRVPVYHAGDLIMVHHTQEQAKPSLSAGQVLDAGRTRIARAWIEDSEGKALDCDLYTVDREAGTLTMASPLDLNAYTAPFTFIHRIEDLRLVSDVDISGWLTVTRPFSHNFPKDETRVSGVLLGGDRQARYTNLFEQATWTGVWSDSRIGNDIPASYNDVDYPIEVSNKGTVSQRWRIQFTSSTAFTLTGESIGQIAIGSTSEPLAPINPNTGLPYFVLDEAGWGSGWAAGNVVRFNTVGTEFGVWVVRTVQQSDLASANDRFTFALLGNVDTP